MPLTVADIDRWDPGDVREVFHAARSRAEAAMEAADGLAQLPAFENWGGDAAEAAREAIGKTRADLNAHGEEALAVARAADQAAGGIEGVQRDLAYLREEAEGLGMAIDPVTSTVVAGPGFDGPPVELMLKIAQLQPDLDAIVARANRVDDELARAINMAGGTEPIPNADTTVGAEGLTPTQVASGANEQWLREETAGAQARVDQLQARIDELARNAYMGADHGPATNELEGLAGQLTDAKGRLGELNAVSDALARAPETYLTMFDPRTGTGKPILAAVAVGNPDTATNVSVTVPGVGSTTGGSLPGMVTEARNLQREVQRQLGNAGLPGSVATIAWMGYDPPPNAVNTLSPSDAWATMTDDQARVGAPSLSSYLEQVRANNPTGQLTLLGHSYGSLTSSLALQDLAAQGVHPVNDVVFYGSPGLQLSSPDQLGLSNGQAYVMQAPGDPITGVAAPLAPFHDWGANPYGGGMTELSSQTGLDSGGVWRDGVQGHADYPRMGGNGELLMSGYNLAAITAGLPDNTVLAPPALPQRPFGGGLPRLPQPASGGG